MLAILSILGGEAGSLVFIQTYVISFSLVLQVLCINLALLLLNMICHFKCLLKLAK